MDEYTAFQFARTFNGQGGRCTLFLSYIDAIIVSVQIIFRSLCHLHGASLGKENSCIGIIMSNKGEELFHIGDCQGLCFKIPFPALGVQFIHTFCHTVKP